MKSLVQYLILTGLLIQGSASYSDNVKGQDEQDIVIENSEMRLVIGRKGMAVSLIHKPTGQECLQPGVDAPVFSVTQYTPYQDELQLSRPAKPTTFFADSITRVGDDLIVNFELVNIEVTIGLRITDSFIGFTLKEIDHHPLEFGDHLKTPVDEVTILQLPVRDRDFFGEWLNVGWDQDVAINILGSDPYVRIDAVKYRGYRLLQAGSVSEIKSIGVGAVLIVTATDNLLDRIERVEVDYDLPKGVQSRRSKEYKYSYWQGSDITPQNVDEYIRYAKKAGLRAIQINWTSFAKAMGHFPWRSEYPNGIADLQTVTRKIKDAGMIVGANFWYSKAHTHDLYVSPVPDHRLNLRTVFTLATALEKTATTITVEENPQNCTLDEGRRILKIGEELIEYQSFTAHAPYQFTGCIRGILNTHSSEFGAGYKFGLLDIDTWPTNWVRFDQRTGIQQEVAERISKIYNEAGFQFCYFNGADDVQPPYWLNVSSAQLKVYDLLKPEPLFSEGAARSHFSWHMLSRGNAFGGFSPEEVKEATRKYPAAEAEYIKPDFTAINFGFIRYVVPGATTLGIQPDMIEYICSRGAAWDSPVSITGNLHQYRTHPRTSDNMEVLRRWEEARNSNFFTAAQKTDLQDLNQEHILLIDEAGRFEIQRYEKIEVIAGGDSKIQAFIFRRSGKTWVVYWHTSGHGNVELDISSDKADLFKEPGKRLAFKKTKNTIIIPASERRYLELDLSEAEVSSAFRNAKINQ